jgi:hypothetical protein
MNRLAVITLVTVLACLVGRAVAAPQQVKAAPKYTVAVYWWPNFHRDSYHQSKKGDGWTEWEIVKHARPLFAGHEQPKVPLWGYRDESVPKEMARSIDALANAGVGAIMFDWYRYDDDIHGGVMIESALRDGLLKAPNRQRIKFALMWANCAYVDCHPFAPGKNFSNAPVWRRGEVSREAFYRHTADAIQRYFTEPNYWKIEGRPYFSIFDPHALITGLGGVTATRAALDSFRERTKAAGFPGLHLNFIDRTLTEALAAAKGQPMPGDPQRKIATEKDLLEALGADSSTWYTWVQQVAPVAGPHFKPERGKADDPLSPAVLMANAAKARVQTRDYLDWGTAAMRKQAERRRELGIPFFPHVARGWDGSPRNYGGGIVIGNTPERYRHFVLEAKAMADRQPDSKGIITLNSWNEWVEGSYLEPDTIHGMAYLDAIRDVFGAGR